MYELAKYYYITLAGRPASDFNKLYFILQNFIVYLTYRSNGSPKKLIKEIHEFIRVKRLEDTFEQDQTIVYRQPPYKGGELYLFFNYDNQYRIGFINYLYRPFLIKYGRSFKLFSDNIIVSTPYLFDHLLKFHPFAFSLSNLELVPEVLSTNKTPSLRDHINKIIDYLKGSHIREIEVGLFDYKFYSRTLNEITFLSKIFEQEAAALNYTLDESYLVKLHIRNKIREQRNIFGKFLADTDDSRHISSITHLNGILGDLHFFDQEYDEAILSYHDSIRPLTFEQMTDINMQDFVTLLRNRLKAALCFEKINAYEEALSGYSDISDDSVRFMTYRLKPGITKMEGKQYIFDQKKIEGSLKPEIYYSGPLSDLLQVVLQSFLSQVLIQEKKSVAGLSELKLCMSLGGFLNITNMFLYSANRNHVIKANAFLHTGNLLYFKNSCRPPGDKDGFEKILPAPFSEYMGVLIKWDDKHRGENRRPVLALFMYLLGLKEMMDFRAQNDEFIKYFGHHKNPVPALLAALKLSSKITEDEQLYRGIYFNYVASFLSNIGDCLLGSFVKCKNGHHLTIEDLFNVEKLANLKITADGSAADDKSEIDFCHFLKKTTGEEFNIQDVLRCYYLSAQYFSRQGKMSGCGFQYRKILYVLRLVLAKGNFKGPLLDTFYGLLQNTLIQPLLQIADQNAANAESHMRIKSLDAEVDSKYTVNNLSNHPESREVILLFHYIQLKTGAEKIENIEFLIAPNNSIATQYGRIQELDFYAKYIRPNIDGKKCEGDWPGDETSIEEAVNYLYSMLSILQIFNIYGVDYWLGYSYIAYSHIRVGQFLTKFKPGSPTLTIIKNQLTSLLGRGSFSSLDVYAHFSKASEYYGQAIRLHNAGEEYKFLIADMNYLEDDFNDSAYHFGAALDRYMMTNGLFTKQVNLCKQEMSVIKKNQ